jgi:hypothetical protein
VLHIGPGIGVWAVAAKPTVGKRRHARLGLLVGRVQMSRGFALGGKVRKEDRARSSTNTMVNPSPTRPLAKASS